MDLSYEATALAFILVGVVTLWVTEALPLPVSALLAAAACVVAGVAPASEVFRPFSQPLVFLFIGSLFWQKLYAYIGTTVGLRLLFLRCQWSVNVRFESCLR